MQTPLVLPQTTLSGQFKSAKYACMILAKVNRNLVSLYLILFIELFVTLVTYKLRGRLISDIINVLVPMVEQRSTDWPPGETWEVSTWLNHKVLQGWELNPLLRVTLSAVSELYFISSKSTVTSLKQNLNKLIIMSF